MREATVRKAVGRGEKVTKAWLILILAGLFEIGWAVGLKSTGGFTTPVPALVYASMVLSVVFLGISMKVLPIGTAYAVWTGIGTIGTAFLGACLFDEPLTTVRLSCIAFIVIGIAGLKIAT